ncbi:O-antigen polymerase [Tunturibacter psychrotolerans]|uniref:O-antigen polymerase n=1 Tax=Tunturiibacter psychrotolerans TaxID=3069686 RepID=A0AAU7ZTM9_9BACT
MTNKSRLLHPVLIFNVVWLGVMTLFLMRFSKVLNATNRQITSAVGLILIPYTLTLGVSALYFRLVPKLKADRNHLLCDMSQMEELSILTGRLKWWIFFWAVFSFAEILASGGVPLVWAVTGNSKTYFDFGIQSLHGLLNSLILAIGLTYTGIFVRYGGRRYLLGPLGVLAWSILLITRSMMIVDLLQSAMVVVLYKGISKKIATRLVVAVILVTVGFGAIGDLRTGAINFRTLAQPTDAYPDWLPSGFLWVYIYVTTPLNNLAYTIASSHPVDNILFPNTAAPLFPHIVRDAIYGDSLATSLSGELVDSAFNVSTAYVGPFQDYGSLGIVSFSVLIAAFAGFYWRRSNFRDQLIYVVIGQCLFMTIFYNHFFSLPVITQIIWIYLFFLKSRSKNPSETAVGGRENFSLNTHSLGA